MEYRDIGNNKISAGDFIAYAIRKGNSGELKIGIVADLAVSESNPVLKVFGISKYTRLPQSLSTLTHLDRLIKLSHHLVEANMGRLLWERYKKYTGGIWANSDDDG